MADSATLTPAIQEYLESLYWLGEAGIEAPGESRGWRLLEHNAGTLPEPVLSDDR